MTDEVGRGEVDYSVVLAFADTGGHLLPTNATSLLSAMVTVSEWGLYAVAGKMDRFASTRARIYLPEPEEIRSYPDDIRDWPISPFKVPNPQSFPPVFLYPADTSLQPTEPRLLHASYANPISTAVGVAKSGVEVAARAGGLINALLHPIKAYRAGGARYDTTVEGAREARARADLAEINAINAALVTPGVTFGQAREIQDRYPHVAPLVTGYDLDALEGVHDVVLTELRRIDARDTAASVDDVHVIASLTQIADHRVEIASSEDWTAPR